ncbi:MAG: protein-L-isoaspartate(D-aspartate) O-methyltransferase [Deltaproteobacteria bacterium]|nr:protein-L-isoaspartate(D-aspartate) O-methyltransferase [Deltaproteobacteria bacterium]
MYPLNNIIILAFMAIFATQACAQGSEPDFEQQRKQMVSQQLRSRDITDSRVLDAMNRVPRHLFVPVRMRGYSYQDSALPIDYGQTISQPYIVALMSQLLTIGPGDKVLEIGTGSGYQAAVLAEMGADVFTIEIVPGLGTQAERLLKSLGYDSVKVKIGDGYLGWPENAPFEAIIVTCAPTEIPEPLEVQLAEGGRMVIPVGESGFQQLLLLEKKEGRIRRQKTIDVRFVPMVDNEGNTY